MVTRNRQIKTGFDPKQDLVTLEILKPIVHNGKGVKVGEHIKVSKDFAKVLLKEKGTCKIVVD